MLIKMCSLIAIFCAIILGIADAKNLDKTDIPCVTDENCKVNNQNTKNAEVSYKCVENNCEFTRNVQMYKRMVTILGAKCSFDEECNIQDAICTNEECACKNGTVKASNKKKCLKVADKIGYACREAVQCNFGNATCKEQICSCNGGFAMDTSDDVSGTFCKQLNGIGFPCEKDTECEIPNSFCTGKKLCDCKEHFLAFDSVCVENNFTFMSRCEVHYECQRTLGPDAHCENNLCQCNDASVFNTFQNRCVQLKDFQDSSDRNSGVSIKSSLPFLLPVLYIIFMITF